MGALRCKAVILAVLGLGFLAVSVRAADLNTVNNTDSYVDPAIAAAFMSVPTLCAAAPDALDNVTACNALGQAAVNAVQGVGPDVYFDPGGDLQATNAFVPTANAVLGQSGYSPIFSQHKYDLFGSGTDMVGIYSREEFLFVGTLSVNLLGGGWITNPQTPPGFDQKKVYLQTLLALPSTDTTVTSGGITFDIANLTFYVAETGLVTGGKDVVDFWCANDPVGISLCPGAATDFDRAGIYLESSGLYGDILPEQCTFGFGDPPSELTCLMFNEVIGYLDQVVVGYVASLPPAGGDQDFAQNLYQEVGGIDGVDPWIMNQYLEQSVALGQAEFEASRQTLQTAWAAFAGKNDNLSQLVSQDVEGYLFSCMNCDTPELIASGGSHAVDAGMDPVVFIPYWSNWHSVPTITHAPTQ